MMRKFTLAMMAAGLFLTGCSGTPEIAPEKKKKGEMEMDMDAMKKGMEQSQQMMGAGSDPRMKGMMMNPEEMKKKMDEAKKAKTN